MKSHTMAELAIARAVSQPGLRMVCVREVQKSLRESAKHLLEKKAETHGVGHLFKSLNAETRLPGGGVIIYQGMQDHTAESIKSLEDFDIAWVEEAQTLSARSWEMLRPTIRADGSEIWCTWNPRLAEDPVDKFFRGENPPENALIIRSSYKDNPWFPAELEAERLHDEQHNRDRYAHIWLGEYEPMAIGAIWDRVTIHTNRRVEMPEMARIVVAVDPAVSSESGSDEHGIIVVGMGHDGRGYLIDDCTTRGIPRQWADRAVASYDRYDADAIVIERNQGGDMVRHTVESVRPGIRIIEVIATRGKHVRAEPISALYSMGRISHVGTFPELEDQMCLMTASGYEGRGSPDRVDALVWGFTELFPSISRGPVKPMPVSNMPRGEGGWML
jgi:hypothetical protein